mmetsp:Transcript_10981/g.20319  ORF Transcript_10981/g.20319 Transcript_10981/m.20319 type:complete len:739 (-) Transcript_10981:401-2617(-)|eukprot:CAMPEP_0184514214 /NCGR_PEP_ID=MMETSP0198_2-20121128/3845_1 /TAXON_ID=1112570 /ORGANISM="Thraustochytrium sp., Strain LLF1b" /LENGTH=738 /DNA_ID=CAMNT_0026904391 /DNA_START=164 /DNA_END=2380 /DNA_ORIENTATION=-
MWGDREVGESEVTGPTFEDLAIDPDLDDVERVVRFATGSVELQRLVHVMMLSDTAKLAGFEVARDRLFPLVDPISKDQESVVRQSLASQLSELCLFCSSVDKEDSYSTMITVLLPGLKRLVADSVQEVRESASIALLQVADVVREDDLMEHVLSIVLELAHDEENDSLRLASAGLLNGLATRFGATLCKQFCVPELISLSQDPSFKVRRAVASSLDKVIRVAEECRERLLPSFLRLCNDPIWGVRKYCADSLALISESVNEQTRVEQLVPLLDHLAQDNSKWVRGALSQRLGRFIASLPAEHVSDTHINMFVEMAKIDEGDLCWINRVPDKSNSGSFRRSSGAAAASLRATTETMGQDTMDFAGSILYCCAFSFPAVVQANPSKWGSTLFPAYKSMMVSDITLVRRTLASSLHEIAKLVGEQVTEEQLVPILANFLLDCDDVRFGVVNSIGSFFAALAPDARERHLSLVLNLFPDVRATSARQDFRPPERASNLNASKNNQDEGSYSDNMCSRRAWASNNNQEDGEVPARLLDRALVRSPRNAMGAGETAHLPPLKWRFRLAIARQLAKFCQLLSTPCVFNTIVPLATHLLNDDVQEVRKAANSFVGPCLRRLRSAEGNNMYQAFQDTVLQLATSRRYQERQQFVDMFVQLGTNRKYSEEVTQSFLEAFFALMNDPVANVRLVVAEGLKTLQAGKVANEFILHPMQGCLTRFQFDRDRDVALAAGANERAWFERTQPR